MAERKKVWLTAAALLASMVVLYGRAVTFDFVEFDDTTLLLGHPNLYGQPSLLANLKAIFFDYFPREEPLLVRDVTWALDAWLFGFKNPTGYHLGNILLNAANVALLFLFLERTTRRFGFALVVTTAFALIPIHVEPVCWVMGRKDVLVAFLMLLALLAQEHGLTSDDPRIARRMTLLVALLSLAALLAKFSAVTFFLVLALHRLARPYLAGERRPDAPVPREELKQAGLAALPLLVMSAIVYRWYNANLSEWGVLGRGPGLFTLEHLTTLLSLLPVVFWRYLGLIAYPANFSISYETPSTDFSPALWEQLAGWSGILVYLGLTVWAHQKRKDLFFWLAAFVALMIPYLNLVYIGIWVANRYLYFAVVCWLVLLVAAAEGLIARFGSPARAAMVALGGSLAVIWLGATWVHQSAWRDNHALWLYESSVDQPTMLAHQALARSFLKQAKGAANPADRSALAAEAEAAIARGIEHYQALGVRPSPYYTTATENFSKLFYIRGQLAALRDDPLPVQLQHYQEAYRLKPASKLNALMLAETHFKIAVRAAEPAAREENAAQSLRYFLEYVSYTNADPFLRQKNAASLERDYAKNFPSLAAQVEDARRRFFQ